MQSVNNLNNRQDCCVPTQNRIVRLHDGKQIIGRGQDCKTNNLKRYQTFSVNNSDCRPTDDIGENIKGKGIIFLASASNMQALYDFENFICNKVVKPHNEPAAG